MLNVPYCNHCHKNYYMANDCWALYPNLKKQSNNKKHPFNGDNNQPKQPKPANDNKDQYNFREASMHMLALPAYTDIQNFWALDTRYIQHLLYKKQNFISMKLYTGKVIQRIGGSII